MTDVTCRLTAKNRNQLRNRTLGSRVWASFASYCVAGAGDVTEILEYSFGDAAKFDGFGKTLRCALSVDRANELIAGVEVQSVSVYKLATVRLPPLPTTPRGMKPSHQHRDLTRLSGLPARSAAATAGVAGLSAITAADSFQVRRNCVVFIAGRVTESRQ